MIYVTIGNLAFRLSLYLTGVHFRGELQHSGQVIEQIKFQPIRTREIAGLWLEDELYEVFEQRDTITTCSNNLFRKIRSHCPVVFLKKSVLKILKNKNSQENTRSRFCF